jgi:hypothetical protein
MTAHRAVLAIAALAALSVVAEPAYAAPHNANTFTLDLTCSDGRNYDITLMQTSSDRAAVHVVDTTSVLVPTAFRWHVVVTDDQGRVLDESLSALEPVHGASVERLDTVQCSFIQFAYHDDPGTGAVTIAIDGTVWAHLPQ